MVIVQQPTTRAHELPDTWEQCTIGELFEIKQGKAVSQRMRTGNKSAPFLRTANILWGRLDLRMLDEMDFSSEERAALRLQPGDLLVCEGGEIGRTAMWNSEIEGCFYQNHLHRLRPRSPWVEPRFVMFWMQAAHLLLRRYQGAGNKTTIPNLSKGRLAAFEIPHPPLPEQRAIASVLNAVQLGIDASERVITIADHLKRSLMQHLFTYGSVSLADARSIPLHETEIGPMPVSWQIGNLGAALQRSQYGLSLRGSRSGDYPMLRMNNLDRGHVSFEDLQFVDLSEDLYHRFELAPGDLLFNRTNSHELVGKTALFDSDRPCVFASYLIRLRTNPDLLIPAFFNQYLNWAPVQARLRGIASRAVSQSNISASKLNLFHVCLPSAETQASISKLLAAADSKILADRSRLAALRQLFRSLLGGLMTGKLRVPPEAIKAAGGEAR